MIKKTIYFKWPKAKMKNIGTCLEIIYIYDILSTDEVGFGSIVNLL